MNRREANDISARNVPPLSPVAAATEMDRPIDSRQPPAIVACWIGQLLVELSDPPNLCCIIRPWKLSEGESWANDARKSIAERRRWTLIT